MRRCLWWKYDWMLRHDRDIDRLLGFTWNFDRDIDRVLRCRRQRLAHNWREFTRGNRQINWLLGMSRIFDRNVNRMLRCRRQRMYRITGWNPRMLRCSRNRR